MSIYENKIDQIMTPEVKCKITICQKIEIEFSGWNYKFELNHKIAVFQKTNL
jgi:hypothetical protein